MRCPTTVTRVYVLSPAAGERQWINKESHILRKSSTTTEVSMIPQQNKGHLSLLHSSLSAARLLTHKHGLSMFLSSVSFAPMTCIAARLFEREIISWGSFSYTTPHYSASFYFIFLFFRRVYVKWNLATAERVTDFFVTRGKFVLPLFNPTLANLQDYLRAALLQTHPHTHMLTHIPTQSLLPRTPGQT